MPAAAAAAAAAKPIPVQAGQACPPGFVPLGMKSYLRNRTQVQATFVGSDCGGPSLPVALMQSGANGNHLLLCEQKGQSKAECMRMVTGTWDLEKMRIDAFAPLTWGNPGSTSARMSGARAQLSKAKQLVSLRRKEVKICAEDATISEIRELTLTAIAEYPELKTDVLAAKPLHALLKGDFLYQVMAQGKTGQAAARTTWLGGMHLGVAGQELQFQRGNKATMITHPSPDERGKAKHAALKVAFVPLNESDRGYARIELTPTIRGATTIKGVIGMAGTLTLDTGERFVSYESECAI